MYHIHAYSGSTAQAETALPASVQFKIPPNLFHRFATDPRASIHPHPRASILIHVNAQELAALPGRAALIAHLRDSLPHLDPNDSATSPFRGGRTAALAALHAIQPEAYARTRNFLTGKVTHLSPYLRHGVLTLSEVRDHALTIVHNPAHAEKFINELAWRDYWQRIYFEIGDGIWQDREAPKTGLSPTHFRSDLPEAVTTGTTTLGCIDAFSQELTATGYLHNHARMWFAAYLTHWLRIRWQAGAYWFLQHLLDGDPASNNLSWQWVASTFSTKPYLFNRENLERYTGGVHCRSCVHASAKTCPFDATYEELTDRLFPRVTSNLAPSSPPAPYSRPGHQPDLFRTPTPVPTGAPLLWIHTDSLNPAAPIFATCPDAPALFVWDTTASTPTPAPSSPAPSISLKRAIFIAECLQQMPPQLEIRTGDPASELLAAAHATQASHIIAQRTPDPRLQAIARTLQTHLSIVWIDPPPFVTANRGFDLKRFSRYWQRAQSSAMQPTRSQP